ncbi:hypothetical protein CA54_33910 [Symmachiella macrocystis]|uniref:Uncharacterized protein n=1 Tax=Symmachiella macrocystis TaxID=2527985 RepID=A0A5C6BV13_9PLAN|nr:hypothetical protein [Symmachiella macrocystis]TWU14524.1 hypothetical protein CA54_33910 [Symmachiella macrocystis]
MARPKGSRTILVRITYDTFGELAGGIAGDTARQYAQRGQFNPRDLDSSLTWVNARRTAKGLPLIGLATEVSEAVSDEDLEAVISTPAPIQTGLLIYNPITACYREDI